jgi:ABC-type glutathione transport system ATPase component
VAIARALAQKPEVLLFDEPTSALDPEMRDEVLAVIRELDGLGMTMLVVTHEMNFAHDVADRVWVMDGGRIVEDGPPADVVDAPKSAVAKEFFKRMSPKEAGLTSARSGHVLAHEREPATHQPTFSYVRGARVARVTSRRPSTRPPWRRAGAAGGGRARCRARAARRGLRGRGAAHEQRAGKLGAMIRRAGRLGAAPRGVARHPDPRRRPRPDAPGAGRRIPPSGQRHGARRGAA